MKIGNSQKGIGVIKVIVLTPLVLLLFLAATFGFYEARKAYWDHRVRDMCEKDGGVQVFEKIILSQKDYKMHSGPDGRFITPPRTFSNEERYKYFSKYLKRHIKLSNPEVYRRETIIYRNSDNHILGNMVHYRRVGGDFPTIIFHATGFGCEGTTNLRPLLDRIFLKENQNDNN